MPDIEIVTAFNKIISKYLVRITANNGNGLWTGTGCIIGYIRNDKYPLKALILTAGHVLKDAFNILTEWSIEHYNDQGLLDKKVIFKTPNDNPNGPNFFYYNADPRLDIGCIFADSKCEDGTSFFNLNNSGIPDYYMPIIDKKEGAGSGTRVAWAGFPSIVEKHLGFPHVCYYEGVISAMIDTPKHPPLYMIDGHGTLGVSGSPIWAWSDSRARVEIVGIIVSYLTDQLPSFVCATPIHPLIHFLEKQYNIKIIK
jgi:hypothetical protein